MDVKVLLFGVLRERAGHESIEVEVAERATVDDVIDALRRRDELVDAIGPAGGPRRFVVAVNRSYADGARVVTTGDEVALIPPVSGGSGEATAVGGVVRHVRISAGPLDQNAVWRAVADPGAGAIVTFCGVTREVAHLHYEAYVEMAERLIPAIAEQSVTRHGAIAAAVEHRVGEVPLGEPSVVVAVSAGHRGEAFAAARELIDRIKAEVPIFKKEIEEDGAARWVEGTVPSPGDGEPTT